MEQTALAGMVVVGLYVLTTAPLLYLLLRAHALKSDYTRWFMAAMMLQILPLGLIFFPLGAIGVVLLAISLAEAHHRHARFKAMGIHNPEVSARWRLEYLYHLWAIGFTLEQKAVAYLFIEVVHRHGFGFFWTWLLPLSGGMWLILGALIIRERRSPPPSPADETQAAS